MLPEISARRSLSAWTLLHFQIPGLTEEGEKCRPLDHMWQIPFLLSKRSSVHSMKLKTRWHIYKKLELFYFPYGTYDVSIGEMYACALDVSFTVERLHHRLNDWSCAYGYVENPIVHKREKIHFREKSSEIFCGTSACNFPIIQPASYDLFLSPKTKREVMWTWLPIIFIDQNIKVKMTFLWDVFVLLVSHQVLQYFDWIHFYKALIALGVIFFPGASEKISSAKIWNIINYIANTNPTN